MIEERYTTPSSWSARERCIFTRQFKFLRIPLLLSGLRLELQQSTRTVSLRYHPSNLCSLAHLQACKAIRPLFYRLAHENSNVLFVEVPVTETNANLHQGLGIPSLPYGHIYSPDGGLVEELKITRPHFPKFAHKLSSYIKGSCELVNGHVESPYDPRTKELSATP